MPRQAELHGQPVLRPDRHLGVSLLAMVAVVLGGFTKYTVLFYALPFCLLFSIREISKKRWGRLLGLGLFGAVIFVSINFPFLHRNDRFFGSPFGPQPGQ